jgi:serine/threonine protein kinase
MSFLKEIYIVIRLYLKRGEIVGRGSFGTVYRCLDLKSGKLLADKEYIFERDNISQQVSLVLISA